MTNKYIHVGAGVKLPAEQVVDISDLTDTPFKKTVRELIRHTTGQNEFDNDKFYETLENKAAEYDWQRQLARLLGRLEQLTS